MGRGVGALGGKGRREPRCAPPEGGCPDIPPHPSPPTGPSGGGRLHRRFLAFGVRRSRQWCQRCPSGACWGRRETKPGPSFRTGGAWPPPSRLGSMPGPTGGAGMWRLCLQPAPPQLRGLRSAAGAKGPHCVQRQAVQRAKIKEMRISALTHGVEGRILQRNLPLKHLEIL